MSRFLPFILNLGGVFVIRDENIDVLPPQSLLELLDQGSNAIYVTEAESGCFVYVNDRACETTGYSRDELLGSHISRVETNFNRAISWDEYVSEVRKNPRFTIRGKHERKDGTTFPVQADVDLVEQDGRQYLLSVIQPLDEREDARDEIVESYSHYSALFQHSPIPLWNFDLSPVLQSLWSKGSVSREKLKKDPPSEHTLREALFSESGILDVNDSALELLDAEEKSEVLENIDTVLTPSSRDRLIEVFQDILQGLYKQEREMSFRTIDGDRRIVLANYTVPPNARDDLSSVFASLVDITPRRRAQERVEKHRREVKKRENQLRQMAENIDEVFYNYASDYSSIYYVSPAYRDIWKRDTEELYQDPWQFADAIHEEDRERVLEKKKRFIDDNPEDGLVTEYRILTPDGKTKWIRDEMYPVRENGERVSIVGSAKDITETKRAKENLERSLEEKETLLGEIHHRVKNNLQVVTSLLKTQARKVDSSRLETNLHDTIRRVKAMALVHEKLYRGERLTDFDFESYLISLCDHLIDFHDTDLDRGNLDLRIGRIDLGLDRAISCGLILTELVSNSLEHGLAGVENGQLEIHFTSNSNEGYRLVVEDNGPGLNVDRLRNKKNPGGFEILSALVEYELDGNFQISSEDGLRTVVTFES